MIKEIQCPAIEPAGFIEIERRSGTDRRKSRLSIFHRPFSCGRRRTLRRQSDRRRIFVLDYYSPKIFYAVTLVLGLSVTDALLTLWLLNAGAQEMNPVMAYFLNFGPNVFLFVKYLLTSTAVVIVVLLNYICIFRVRFQMYHLLKYFAGCFAAVVLWEIVLIASYVF